MPLPTRNPSLATCLGTPLSCCCFLTGVQVLVSAVQQSDSAPRTHITLLPWISFPFRSPENIAELLVLHSGFSLVTYFIHKINSVRDFPGGTGGKEPVCQCKRGGFNPWAGKISWRRKWQPTQVFLPRKSHGHRSLVSYSPWDHKYLDMWLRASVMLNNTLHY